MIVSVANETLKRQLESLTVVSKDTSILVKEKEDLKRVIFFNGSFFFSGRRIDALNNLPMKLPTTEKAEGDEMTVMQMIHYLAPNELQWRL